MTEHIINQILQKNFHGKDDWNNSLRQFKDRNIFQSYEWGELKKLEGWEVLHVTVTDNESSSCILLAQVLIKKVMGIKIAWCPGGPIIQCNKSNNGIDALKKFKEVIFEEKIINLRCKPYMSDTPNNQKIFSTISKSNYSFTSPRTTILKIVSHEDLLKQVKPKHRVHLKKSIKANIIWKSFTGSEAATVFSVIYDEMRKSKNLNLPIIDIEAFSKILGTNDNGEPRLFSFVGLENNKPVTVCVISLLGNKAFYHYAASSERGRVTRAPYGMIFNLVSKLKNLSVEELDFGGISSDGTSGVDHFKLRFNGEELLKVGEFDISKSKVYSYFFNKALQLKKHI